MSELHDALETWKKRRAALEKAYAYETQADKQFELEGDIAHAKANIARLEEEVAASIRPPDPPDPTPRPIADGRHLTQPGYALVIGVSKYAGDEKQKNANQFPNLSFAADDAREFHAVLRNCGYKCLDPLLDDQATLPGIMRAIDDLFKQSSQVRDPLVLIFFAGHGARDDQGRHYLVPHDGLRNDLFATALWNMTLESALRIPQTDRLLLVVDACHAAAIEAPGERGDFQACDPMALVSGESKGRYILASCLANQVSRERDGHGVFSRELLQLMRFEAEEVSRNEELELFQVCNTVKQRVLARAEGQQPWSNVAKETGIVLAINHERRKARTSLEWKVLEQIAAELQRLKFEDDQLLLNALRRAIREGRPTNSALDPRYRFFSQKVRSCRGQLSDTDLHEFCTDLITNYWNAETSFADDRSRELPARPERAQEIANTSRAASVSVVSRPVIQDGPAPLVERSASPFAQQATQLVSGSTGLSSPDASRRCLSGADVDWLFEEIALFIVETNALEKLVSDPNGFRKKEFARALQNAYETLQEKRAEDESRIPKLVDEIGDRFEQVWRKAYKPGPWRFNVDEVKFDRLLKHLSGPVRPVDVWLANHSYHGEVHWADSASLRRHAMLGINAIVHGAAVWDPARFAGIDLRQETQQLFSRSPQGEQLQQLHRLLIEDSYPDAFERKRNAVAPLVTLLGRSHD